MATKKQPTLRDIELAQELQARRTSRKSIVEFTHFTYPRYHANWHHELIAGELEKLGRKDSNNLMVFAPPRHGKSELVAIRWPAWTLGVDPVQHFITTAYGDKLATTFSRAARNVIKSPQYQRLWPTKFKTENDTQWEIARQDDDNRASYIAAGILSALTGEGATRLVIDDPVKNAEEAYSKIIRDKIYTNYLTAARTRMAPGGKKVLCMTRWHEDDLAGRLIKAALTDKKADQWTVIVLAATNDDGEDSYIWNTRSGEKSYLQTYSALWPEAYSREELDNTRASLGPVFWDAMYMQRPSAAQGSIFKRENWVYYDGVPQFDLAIQVYDTAHAEGQDSDYSASISLGAGKSGFPVLDAWRGKVSFPLLVQRVYERWDEFAGRHGRYPDRVLVEGKGSGISLIQQIETNNLAGCWTFPDGSTRRVPLIPVLSMPATVSKFIRAQGISGYHESKLISLPRGADWVPDFVDEHAVFDKGPHDDYVDCTVHGVTYMVRPTEEVEEMVSYSEPIQISSDLDQFDSAAEWVM